jgi:hypothetical protein
MLDIIPYDFKCIDPDILHFHRPHFDVGRMASGLGLISPHSLTCTSNGTWRSCFAKEGFSVGSGLHTWSVECLDLGPNKHFMVGISENTPVTTFTYPGGPAGSAGASYYLYNGHRVYAARSESYGPIGSTHCVVRVLLDMNNKTVAFYLNGIRLGCAAGPDVLSESTYYPVISFLEAGQIASILPVPEAESPPVAEACSVKATVTPSTITTPTTPSKAAAK